MLTTTISAGNLIDGFLQLRCDYRTLNSKTVQDTPSNQNYDLRGNQYFSLLDQGRAYHQIHLKPSLPLLHRGVFINR